MRTCLAESSSISSLVAVVGLVGARDLLRPAGAAARGRAAGRGEVTGGAARLAGLAAARWPPPLAAARPRRRAAQRHPLAVAEHRDRATPRRRRAAPRPGRGAAGDDTITVTPLGGDQPRRASACCRPSATGFAARALGRRTPAAEVRGADPRPPRPGRARRRGRSSTGCSSPRPTRRRAAARRRRCCVARIDRLLGDRRARARRGALIDRAGPDTPELFRRWFDVGLLLDDAGRALRGAPAEPRRCRRRCRRGSSASRAAATGTPPRSP